MNRYGTEIRKPLFITIEIFNIINKIFVRISHNQQSISNVISRGVCKLFINSSRQ